jgi:hypothetical protein
MAVTAAKSSPGAGAAGLIASPSTAKRPFLVHARSLRGLVTGHRCGKSQNAAVPCRRCRSTGAACTFLPKTPRRLGQRPRLSAVIRAQRERAAIRCCDKHGLHDRF